jgi:hypothetical protein
MATGLNHHVVHVNKRINPQAFDSKFLVHLIVVYAWQVAIAVC